MPIATSRWLSKGIHGSTVAGCSTVGVGPQQNPRAIPYLHAHNTPRASTATICASRVPGHSQELLWPRGRNQAARQLQAADCDIESDLAEGRAECERRLHASRPGGPGRGTLDGWALQCTTHHSHHGPSITPSLKSGDGGEMVGRFVQVHGCRLSERLSVGGPADPAPIRVHWRHAVHPTSARVRPGSADLKRH